MKILNKSFYQRDTITVARALLGKKLIRIINGQQVAGIITETEGYCFENDSASHAFKGKTKRNAPMFGDVGCAYVYFVYGNHFCFNIVAKENGVAAGGVLIRAVKPVDGIELIKKNRASSKKLEKRRRVKENISILTNGPGKLTQAFAINKEHNFVNLTQEGELFIAQGIKVDESDIMATPRIGISCAQDKLWRFYVEDFYINP